MSDTEGIGRGSKWFQLIMRVPQIAVDLVSAWFIDAESLGLEYLDQSNPEPPCGILDGQVEIRASFDSRFCSIEGLLQGAELERKRLMALFAGPWSSSVKLSNLKEEDWANSWREHSHPIRIGRFFIHPGWIEPDPGAPFAVRIDPGMAFGTGLHPSTRMCMEWMDRIMQETEHRVKVLDVGCGSGVLAIGAALAGASDVVAVDTDPEACRVTMENMEFNGVVNRIEVVHGGPRKIKGSFSLVLANILSGVLLEMREDFARLVQPGGNLVLSGVLGNEGQAVRESFEKKGMIFVARQDEDEWCSLRMRRA